MAAKAQPKPDHAALATADAWRPKPGMEWRVRPAGYGPPSQWPRPAFYGTEADVRWEAEGWEVPHVVERAYRYGYRVPTPPPLTVHQLALEGLAQQHPGNVWRITPEGERRLADHARPTAAVPR